MDVDKRRNGRDKDEDGAASSDEEGIDLMNSEGDSSEEDSDEDPEEEARIREGEAVVVASHEELTAVSKMLITYVVCCGIYHRLYYG